MNIYRGCCHGCIYCDSRSDCYQNKEFDTVKAKEGAIEIIRRELSGKRARGVIATGAMSDPYNAFEARQELTRGALRLIGDYGFGVAIATKGTLVTRDIDELLRIRDRAAVIVKVTITTAEDGLSKKLEPDAPPASERFSAVRELSEAGLFAGILLMPVLPYINDTEENVLSIAEQAVQAGAKFIYPAFGVTMRDGQREYFLTRLDSLYPGMLDKYIKRYGSGYSCVSDNAKTLWRVFSEYCKKHGILYDMQSIIAAYKTGFSGGQISMF